MDDTTCLLCTTTYSDPRLLPCTHTFCLACIESFTNCKEPGDRVQCVLCGSEFTIPESGINGLPTNTFVAKLAQKKIKVSRKACVGKHKSTTDATTSSTLTTHNCPTITRSSPQCKAANFVWRSKSAELLLTTDSAVGDGCRSKRAGSVDCVVHRDKNIELYCHDCATTICVLCYIEDHSRHRCSDITKVASQFREQVSSDAVEIAGGIDRCLVAQEILAVGRIEYSVRASEIRAEVQNKAAEIKRKVDSDMEVILYGLDAIEKDYISDIDVMSKIVDRQATQMAIYEKSVTQLLSDRTTPAEIAADSNSLHEKANELLHFDAVVNATKCTMKSNDFKLLVNSTEQQTNIIGELIHEKTFDAWVDMKPNLTPIVLRHVILKGLGPPICLIASLHDLIYVLRFRCRDLEIYSATTFSLARTISLCKTPSADPRGIAVCHVSNCLYVSDQYNFCIHRVELGANIKTAVTMWSTGTEPAGLSISNGNNVLVTLTRVSRIKEFTTQGAVVRVINLHPFITSPWHCVQLPTSGRLIVTHSCPTRGVSILDRSGKLLNTIENYESSSSGEEASSPMNTPRVLLVVGPLCTVLVADFKRILVLDQSLCFARELPMSVFSSLKQPYALSFDEARARLYVVDRSRGRAVVFDNIVLPMWSSKASKVEIEKVNEV